MQITIGIELFKKSIYVSISSPEIVAAFEGITGAYVGQRTGDSVSFQLCRSTGYVGMFTVCADVAAELIATFKEHGVFRDANSFELKEAC